MASNDDEFGFGFGLFPDGGKIPHYCIKLTAEEAKIVLGKTMTFYYVNGKTLFEIRDKDGNLTGEFAFYVMFE